MIKQSTAAWVLFQCVDDDAAAEYAPKTGLTFASGELKVAKAGTTVANAANYATVVEASNGFYWYQLSTSETNTVGPVALIVNQTDVYADVAIAQVVAIDVTDGTDLGLSNLDAAVSSNAPANMAAALLDLTDGVETGMTPRQALRLLCAIVGGLTTGGGTNSEVFRAAVSNAEPRATVTITGANRTAITYDLS